MKKQTSYLHQVFHQFALEYCGDTNASSQLYAAYLKQLVELKMKEVEEMPNKIREETVKQISNVTRSQRIFIQMFDGFCKSVSMGELSRWNKYSKPVVLDDNFDNFMHVSEHQAFGDLWRVLVGMHGLNDKHKREANQTGYKRCHVFFQIVSLIHISSPHLLSWWAMIQSVTNYGLGLGLLLWISMHIGEIL